MHSAVVTVLVADVDAVVDKLVVAEDDCDDVALDVKDVVAVVD
jgi:hypothetical protein